MVYEYFIYNKNIIDLVKNFVVVPAKQLKYMVIEDQMKPIPKIP